MSRLPLAALLTIGCGYQSGQVVPAGGRTIAVPLFTNRTYRPDLERDLTRAVQQEIVARTGFHIVDEAADPDLVLVGRLVSVSEEVLSQRSRGRIRESSVLVTAVVTVEDRRTGEKAVEKVRLTERQAFAPVKGESLRTAEVAAMRGLAERIVYTLSAAW
jgi:outer membrane lipopolysaccharide assembly protein LptE/RlpB